MFRYYLRYKYLKYKNLKSNQKIALRRRLILIIVLFILLILYILYKPQIKIVTNKSPIITGNISEPKQLERVEIKETKTDLGVFKLTAYCSCKKCCGKWSPEVTGKTSKTASGTIPQINRTVAADTSILPFGTILEINGIRYIVEDTGSKVKGKHIDIYYNNHQSALQSGLTKGNVYKIKEV